MDEKLLGKCGFYCGCCPTSSITGITIAQALVCQVVDNLVQAGIEPPVFKSSNVDGGDAHNHRMFERYYGYWK